MGRSYGNFRNISEVLQGLLGTEVTIILVSGQKICGCVDAVLCEQKPGKSADGLLNEQNSCGFSSPMQEECNLLVMSACNRVIFVDINCICVVCTCCEDVLEFALNNMHSRGRSNN